MQECRVESEIYNSQQIEPFNNKFSDSILGLGGMLDLETLSRGTQRQFSENISLEDDLRSRIFRTFIVKFLACLPLLGFSNI